MASGDNPKLQILNYGRNGELFVRVKPHESFFVDGELYKTLWIPIKYLRKLCYIPKSDDWPPFQGSQYSYNPDRFKVIAKHVRNKVLRKTVDSTAIDLAGLIEIGEAN